MTEEVETKNGDPEVLNVYPLKKGKRILVFLADYFLIFIFSLLLFHLAAYPLGRVIIRADEQYQSYLVDTKKRDSVLYGNGLLFIEEGRTGEIGDLQNNVYYTCKRLAGVYVNGAAESDDIFFHYDALKGKSFGAMDLYREIDAKTAFFDLSGAKPLLKPVYVDEFAPLYRTGDEMSTQGKKDYAKFQTNFFLPCFKRMLQHINANGLSYNGVNYVEMQKKVDVYNRNMDMLILSSALIAFGVSWLVVYALFPIANRQHKTLGMLFLRVNRISSEKLTLIDPTKVMLTSIYGLAFSASSLVFVPWGTIGFNELFSLPMTMPLSLVSLALAIISLGFLLFDSFGRSLGDRLSFTVMVDEDTLANIYRAKGYDF